MFRGRYIYQSCDNSPVLLVLFFYINQIDVNNIYYICLHCITFHNSIVCFKVSFDNGIGS